MCGGIRVGCLYGTCTRQLKLTVYVCVKSLHCTFLQSGATIVFEKQGSGHVLSIVVSFKFPTRDTPSGNGQCFDQYQVVVQAVRDPGQKGVPQNQKLG
jgi:hypothetical protein